MQIYHLQIIWFFKTMTTYTQENNGEKIQKVLFKVDLSLNKQSFPLSLLQTFIENRP